MNHVTNMSRRDSRVNHGRSHAVSHGHVTESRSRSRKEQQQQAAAQPDSAGRSKAACRRCRRCEKRDEPNPTPFADGLRSQHHRGRR